MAVIFKTYNIPNTSRRKYGDYPSESSSISSNRGGGGSGGAGGVQLWEVLDSGSIITEYNAVSSGDVAAYGTAEFSGYTELSVIDNLESTATPHYNYALSAYMGRELSGMVNTKQEKLVSGVTIKTINGQNILGSGNIEIQGGGSGGSQYYAGSGISIDNNTISLSANVFNEIYNKLGSGDTAYDSARLGGSAATEFAKTLDLNLKYDKTGGTVSGQVLALEDVLCYGASSVVPTGLSVINNLTSTSTTNALSAKQGKVLNEKFSGKQDTLVSGTNIKTINGMSLLGSGNIEIQGGGGGQTIYYTGGTNIKIEDFVISVSGAVQSAVTAVSATTSNDSAKLGGSAATEFVKLSQMNDALDLKYDKTGGTITGSVHATGTISASGDIMTYGQSAIVPTGITVVQDLIHSANTLTNVLAARQGYLLDKNKQDKLVSGTNIKTINGNSLLGSGNIVIEGGGGSSYVGGTNIQISNGTISVTGRVESASTCLTAATATTTENATYASRLGTSSAYYTKSSLDTALNGKLGTGDTAANASKLGNVAASGYLTTGGTAYDSNRLGGTAASSYAKTNGTYSQMTVGTASESTYASRLGASGAYYDKSSLDTAFSGKLGTGGTAYDSTRWGGYKIVVGPIGSAANTIYFGY